MAHLNSGRLNLATLRDLSRSELLDVLDSIPGTKSIIWDQKLILPFGLLSEHSLLKSHQVVQMIELRGGRLPTINSQNVVYFVQPNLSHMDWIADNIKSDVQCKQQNIEFHLVFIPVQCVLCENKLQALGVFGDFKTRTFFSPDFYIHDCDLLSLEWPLSFRECTIEQDYSSLYQAARSLMTLQCVFGLFPQVIGIGKYSKHIYDLLLKMRREISGSEPSTVSQFDQLILIDRSVDLLSPMVQQLSYEGLLDEIYGIRQTAIDLPGEKFQVENEEQNTNINNQISEEKKKKRFYLNSSEELFKNLRDNHFLNAGVVLNKSAKSLSLQFDERKTAKSVRELKLFVDKMPYLQKLRTTQANHTSMLELVRQFTDREEFHEFLYMENELLNCVDIEAISPYIESCINKMEPLSKVLRLMAIQTFCANGLKTKVLDAYKTGIIQTYGHEHLLTLYTLEECGILRASGTYGFSGRSYSMIRNRLKLIWPVESVNGQKPAQEVANVHHGYMPLTARIVQHLEQFGYRSLHDLLSRYLLKADVPIFDENIPMSSTFKKRRNSDATSMQSSPESNQKLTLVFFVGGCTYAEISALRCLSSRDGINSDYVIATTSVINGRTFFKSLCDPNIQFD